MKTTASATTIPADLRTRETADMFMALIVKKLLKEKAAAAPWFCQMARCLATASRAS